VVERSPSGRATHERSLATQSPPTVGIPNALPPIVESLREISFAFGSVSNNVGRTSDEAADTIEELLEALEAVLDTCGARQSYHALRYAEAVEQAERTIAKARGEA
jgi:ABC-type transporter Mla subunit MlaD